MPMMPDDLEKKMKQTVFNELKKQFLPAASKGQNYGPIATEHLEKIATAVSKIAKDIVMEITKNAEVTPGIQVVGSGGGVPGPMSGATVSTGKIT
jgi:hypothetical protein